MVEVTNMQPLYYFYLGSVSTPPCDEYAYHIVVGKPVKIATCQLKVLRENTLATSEERQIHSRLTQINKPNDYKEPDDDGDDDDDEKNKKKKGKGGKGGKGSKGGAGGEGDGGDFGPDSDTSGGLIAISKISKNPNIYSYVPKPLLALLKTPLKDRLIDPKLLAAEDELNC